MPYVVGVWHSHFMSPPKHNLKKSKKQESKGEDAKKFCLETTAVTLNWFVVNKKRQESEERLKSIPNPPGWFKRRANIWTHTGVLKARDFLDFIEKYGIYVLEGTLEAEQFALT